MTTRRTETIDLSVRDLKDITHDCAQALVDACRVALAVLNENLALLEQLESVTSYLDDEVLSEEQQHRDQDDASRGAAHTPIALRYDNMMTPEQYAELCACIHHKETSDEEART